jgi:phosphoribosylglycinamide formyltransferase-1
MKHLAIFASGNGTNAKAIIEYFRQNPEVKIECIICNNAKGKVLTIAQEFQIPYYIISRSDLYKTDHVLNLLKSSNIDLVILAGFLWMIPVKLLEEFPNRIINIHPALLPKFGGEGMYGQRVHESVLYAGEKETGITIHYLNDKYDEGEIIFQKSIPLNEDDTSESIAERVHELEHEWYPRIIEELLNKQSLN